MRRRWLLMLELLLLIGILAWVGVSLLPKRSPPPGAIDLKVQLAGASDRAFLVPDVAGNLHYEILLDDGIVQNLTPVEFAQRLHADQTSRSSLAVLLNVSSPTGFLWVALGLLGQVLFTGRMIVQWLASEKNRRSVVPTAFWWMSLIGATMLLVYFLWRKEPIGVLGQATGWFIYVRNLWLIHTAGTPAAAG